jgi:hypothetical protein
MDEGQRTNSGRTVPVYNIGDVSFDRGVGIYKEQLPAPAATSNKRQCLVFYTDDPL